MSDRIHSDVPQAARIWNYWLGGKDNYAVDRSAADAVSAVYPDIVTMAAESRRFLVRTVRHLTGEAGLDQLLDIGSGLPTMQNTHQVAQSVLPRARVVYVDNDPLVLVHARALLTDTTPEGAAAYVDGDYHSPEEILRNAGRVLDLGRPVVVMFMGVLGYVAEPDDVRDIVHRTMSAVPSGSHLVLWDGTDTGAGVVEGGEALVDTGAAPYHLRGPDQLARCFDGLELLEPGLVPIPRWRPETGEPVALDAYGGVARKP